MATKLGAEPILASSSTEQAPEPSPTPQFDLSAPAGLVKLLSEAKDNGMIREHIGAHMQTIAQRYGLDSYTVIIMYDDRDPISSYHANKVYQAASGAAKSKDILLIIHSGGGSIEPAYLISKTCKRLSADRFVVCVPRKAKSAATLLTLGADEVHMGLMSELGPIDPQIGGYPALSLSNALNVLAELTSQFPGAAEMFAQYLTKNLDLKDLGYFKRVGESAIQYAERLLSDKPLPDGVTPQSLANHFVNHYKDHGFVIDVEETGRLLGPQIVKQDTAEYRASNEIYQVLDFAGIAFDLMKDWTFDYVGSLYDGLTIRDKRSSA